MFAKSFHRKKKQVKKNLELDHETLNKKKKKKQKSRFLMADIIIPNKI